MTHDNGRFHALSSFIRLRGWALLALLALLAPSLASAKPTTGAASKSASTESKSTTRRRLPITRLFIHRCGGLLISLIRRC